MMMSCCSLERLELHHQATFHKVLMHGLELLLHSLWLQALGLIDMDGLISVIITLVLLPKELA
jgi:hypothetical protein